MSSKYLNELRGPLKLTKGEMIQTSYIKKRGLAKNLKTTSNSLAKNLKTTSNSLAKLHQID